MLGRFKFRRSGLLCLAAVVALSGCVVADDGYRERPYPGWNDRPSHNNRPDYNRPNHNRPDHNRPGNNNRPDNNRPGNNNNNRPDNNRPGNNNNNRPDNNRPSECASGQTRMVGGQCVTNRPAQTRPTPSRQTDPLIRRLQGSERN